ncbi:MAG: phytoene/squalene synthase family protein [Fibrobacterota bacterium]
MRERVLAGDASVAPEFCREWLQMVSRTFALNIRILPEALQDTIRLAYLFMRIADTVEDDRAMPAAQRKELLDQYCKCFASEGPVWGEVDIFRAMLPASWKEESHPDQFLVAHCQLVFQVFATLPADLRHPVDERVKEMCSGMVHYAVQREEDGWFRLRTRQELFDYCYFVAGTVGLMLTDLFASRTAFISKARKERLRSRSVAFGLGLQMVNIARDIPADWGRRTVFVPQELCEAHGISPEALPDPTRRAQSAKVLTDLIRLADHELLQAQKYVLELPCTAFRVRLFCLWPLLMAHDTLALLARNPAAALDPASRIKIGRRRVKMIVYATMATCWSNSLLRLQFWWRNRAMRKFLSGTSV